MRAVTPVSQVTVGIKKDNAYKMLNIVIGT